MSGLTTGRTLRKFLGEVEVRLGGPGSWRGRDMGFVCRGDSVTFSWEIQ
jgi:hypothetical protein